MKCSIEVVFVCPWNLTRLWWTGGCECAPQHQNWSTKQKLDGGKHSCTVGLSLLNNKTQRLTWCFCLFAGGGGGAPWCWCWLTAPLLTNGPFYQSKCFLLATRWHTMLTYVYPQVFRTHPAHLFKRLAQVVWWSNKVDMLLNKTPQPRQTQKWQCRG